MAGDRSSSRRHALAALSVLLVVATARAQGPLEGEHEIGVPYLIPPAVVRLNGEQRDKIVSIRRELHDRYCTLSGELLHAQEDLRAQLARQPRSTESIAEAARRVAEIRDRIRAAGAEAEARAAELLTPGQRAVLARWREGRRRAGGESGETPYTVHPGIQSDEPDIENLEEPERKPRY